MMILRFAGCVAMTLSAVTAGAQNARPPLAANDIADITTLVMLEDHRRFDTTALTRMLGARHFEVRRRAALAIGRIANPAGRALLRNARRDRDTSVAATVVFATAQLYDTASVGWLDSLMSGRSTPPTVATEAARALGMIRTPESRAALAKFLVSPATASSPGSVIGEALLSLGRHPRGDLAPILAWTTSRDVEIRWRATWALFRPRGPASIQHLLALSNDPEAAVRNWAVRGLSWPQVDSSGVDVAAIRARLRAMLTDADRSVRTEAVRTLATHPDSASVMLVAARLRDPDTWVSVSAAEGLAAHRAYAAATAPMLAAAVTTSGRCALRVVALNSLSALAQGFAPAEVMARDTSAQCRTAAVAFYRLAAERARRALDTLRSDSVADVSAAARTAYVAMTDTTQGRGGRGGGGRAGAGGGGRGRAAVVPTRTEADYRRIVERWIVPDYQGAPRPRAEWTMRGGTFEIELYPGDAPIAVDDFVKFVEAGSIVGVVFTRLVPDFVAQQQPIPGAVVARDEVNRHRLTRNNLAWATAGLDTGRPGYTLGHTVQPHNEGGFTSVGRVVSGMDVVDRIELGDRVLSTRMTRSR